MPGYDFDASTPTPKVKRMLARARKEGRIYVVARIVAILRNDRGCGGIYLSEREHKALVNALASIRRGRKVLARWLPIGYQTARFIWLIRQHKSRNIKVTERDIKRMKAAARYYEKNDDRFNRRQLRSLRATAKEIGVTL